MRSGQSIPRGVGRCLSSVGGIGFIQDVAYVGGDCSGTEKQLFGKSPVRLSSCDKPQHFHLSLGQAVRVGRGSRRLSLNPLQPLGYALF